MDQRVAFVLRAAQGEESMTALCRTFAISRPTGYLWLRRYRASGNIMALAEHSRRPKRIARQTEEAKVAAVLALRDEKGWGAAKLVKVLSGRGVCVAPATAHRILQRGERIKTPAVRPAAKRFARESCNELAQMDFKGEYTLGHGAKCYPLSFLDDCSRYLHGLWPLSSTGGAGVKQSLEGYFRAHGVPQSILTDHGTPWFSTTNQHGLTWLAVWLIKQGVILRYSGVGHPQTQGKVERFHRTLKARTRHRGAPSSQGEWQRWAAEFQQEYNYERPHEALGMKTPGEVYQPVNLRPYQEQPCAWDYSGGLVKRLNSQGMLYYQKQSYFVSEALASEFVRLDQLDEHLLVTFRHLTVRQIAVRTGKSTAVLLPARTFRSEPKV
jgi:transposase InsO family protein